MNQDTIINHQRHRDISALCERLGIPSRQLDEYLSGRRQPAGWMQREIAQALNVAPRDIWHRTNVVERAVAQPYDRVHSRVRS